MKNKKKRFHSSLFAGIRSFRFNAASSSNIRRYHFEWWRQFSCPDNSTSIESGSKTTKGNYKLSSAPKKSDRIQYYCKRMSCVLVCSSEKPKELSLVQNVGPIDVSKIITDGTHDYDKEAEILISEMALFVSQLQFSVSSFCSDFLFASIACRKKR